MSEDTWVNRRLWEIRPVRDLLLILVLAAVFFSVYYVRATLAPIAVAFALAFAVDPLVQWMHRRHGVPRIFLAFSMVVVLAAIFISVLGRLAPEIGAQIAQFEDKIPTYVTTIQKNLGIADASSRPSDGSNETSSGEGAVGVVAETLGNNTGEVVDLVGTVAAGAMYVVYSVVSGVAFFIIFTTYFPALFSVTRYVPRMYRETVEKILGFVSGAFRGYIQGQLLVALFTTTGFCLGFFLVGVPYWFVIGLIGGVCSLIPYGQSLGWLLAILMKFLESQTGSETFSAWSVMALPTLVYIVTQSIESWLITPIVQGEETDLHPATIISVLVLGGSIAGLVGMVLAIPLTASLKAIFKEFVKPWIDGFDAAGSSE